MNRRKQTFLAKREVCRRLLRDIDGAIMSGEKPAENRNVLYWLDVLCNQPETWLDITILHSCEHKLIMNDGRIMDYPEEVMLEREYDFFYGR